MFSLWRKNSLAWFSTGLFNLQMQRSLLTTYLSTYHISLLCLNFEAKVTIFKANWWRGSHHLLESNNVLRLPICHGRTTWWNPSTNMSSNSYAYLVLSYKYRGWMAQRCAFHPECQNNSPSRRLNNRAPVEFETNMKPGSYSSLALASFVTWDIVYFEFATTLRTFGIDDMLQALEKLQKRVKKLLSLSRTREADWHHAKTHVRLQILPSETMYFLLEINDHRSRFHGAWSEFAKTFKFFRLLQSRPST